MAEETLCAYVVQATDRFFLEACKAAPTPAHIDRTMRMLATSYAFKLLSNREVRGRIQQVQSRIGHFEDDGTIEEAIARAAAGKGPTLDGTSSSVSDAELAEILRTSVLGKGGDA